MPSRPRKSGGHYIWRGGSLADVITCAKFGVGWFLLHEVVKLGVSHLNHSADPLKKEKRKKKLPNRLFFWPYAEPAPEKRRP